MTLRNLFRSSPRLRALPLPVRWAGSMVLVLIALGLRYFLIGPEPLLPYLAFFPAVFFAAALFGQGGGFFATASSTLLAVYFFVEPVHSLALARATDTVGMVFFLLGGAFLSAATEALHAAYQAAEAAHARATAGERERDLLLAEFGHRVKNDMQRLMATIRLQARSASPEVAAALYGTADRLRVVAAVHDRLALQSGHLLVEMQAFLSDLVQGLQSTVTDGRPIGLFLGAEDQRLSASRAGAVGLVVNELVTNAVKHAFPGDRAGIITVQFRRDGADLLLIVADDGVGMPARASDVPPVDAGRRIGIGRRLVRALAAQLGGQLETLPAEPTGTSHVLRFPAAPLGSETPIRRHEGASERGFPS